MITTSGSIPWLLGRLGAILIFRDENWTINILKVTRMTLKCNEMIIICKVWGSNFIQTFQYFDDVPGEIIKHFKINILFYHKCVKFNVDLTALCGLRKCKTDRQGAKSWILKPLTVDQPKQGRQVIWLKDHSHFHFKFFWWLKHTAWSL